MVSSVKERRKTDEMMNYKMETTVKSSNGKISRSVRSYKTLENAKKAMKEWVKELDNRKAKGYLVTYHVHLFYDTFPLDNNA